MQTWLWVGLGGFVGAMIRFSVYRLVSLFEITSLPLATPLVNITGCFIIGYSVNFAERFESLKFFSPFFVVGVLGAYTTFSTFGLENMKLIEAGRLGWAIANSCLQVVLGILAVYWGKSF